jgi:general nucleoside transport system permease protein
MERAGRWAIAVAVPVAAVVAALLTVAVLLLIVGSDPISVGRSMLDSAFGDSYALATTLNRTVPRLLAALGIAVALRAGLWNIGAEGQIYIGALAAAAVALEGPVLPTPLSIVVVVGAGALAGAGWGAIPGALRARRGVSEVITSLMLVYIAIQLVNYVVESHWTPAGATFPASPLVDQQQRLPIIWDGTLLNAGAWIALAAVPLTWLLVSRTRIGLRMRAVGGNPNAARFAGIGVGATITSAMAISGAFAGAAGAIEVIGTRGQLIEGFSPGYGFEAIAIALLGRLQPAGILAAALLFGALDAGGAGLQTAAKGVPSAIVQVTVGLAVVYVLIGLGARELMARRRRTREALATALEGEQAMATTAA